MSDNAEFVSAVGEGPLALGLVPPESALLPGETPVRELRRRRAPRRADPVSVISLREVDGVLSWHLGSGFARPTGLRRGRARAAGELVAQYKFEDLPPNRVDARLTELDAWLTPRQGLRVVTERFEVGGEAPTVPANARVLLFIHGTFSHVGHLLEELREAEGGRELLADLRRRYTHVLAFDHPTLSVSPVLNALDLARQLHPEPVVDVICHSRGGLVARWWREVFDPARRGRVVFVGSPLAGTSLAAPHRLKEALDWLTNVSRALTVGAKTAAALVPVAAPLFTAAAVLMQVITSVAKVGSKTPLLDAAVAVVPGLASQSRQGLNAELRRLRLPVRAAPDDYFAVRSDFEPQGGVWRWLTETKARAANAAADLVFDAPNDLVVDTGSMTDLADGVLLAPERLHDFETNDRVHHTNYFRQRETVQLLRAVLLPP